MECSTPCGITEVGTAIGRDHDLGPCHAVLNALRHHRGRHRIDRHPLQKLVHLCSTPCGITEVGTFHVLGTRFKIWKCSTPCGITEVGTRPAPTSPRSPGRVLNALRHHRGRHKARRSSCPKTPGREESPLLKEKPRLGRAALLALTRWVARRHEASSSDDDHDLDAIAGRGAPAPRRSARPPRAAPAGERSRSGGPRP